MIILKLSRKIYECGTLVGSLTCGGTKICDTMENAINRLPLGEYPITIARCQLAKRKMPFVGSVPDEEVCQWCLEERKNHLPGHVAVVCAIPCSRIQRGNGTWNLRQGSIIVGEAKRPAVMVNTEETFLRLYDRLKKAISRGNEVVLDIG